MAGKFNRFKIKKLQINLTNRWLYTLIVFFSLVLVGVFVYAVVPNPGHSINAIEQPSECTAGQFLKWTDAGWACETITPDGGSETDPFWTGNSTLVPYLASANTFTANNIFNQDLTVDTNTLFVNSSTDNVGIGTTNPAYKLDVNGSVKANLFTGDGSSLTNIVVRVTPINDVCSSNNDGILRYRSSYCAYEGTRGSSLSICMRTAASFYQWYDLKTFLWIDYSCDFDGCPPGQYYYECIGIEPGCYASMPRECYESPEE